MLAYIRNRIIYGSSVIFGVIVVVFLIFHTLPGDPVSLMAGNRATPETIAQIRQDLGLDKPLAVQLLYYLNDLSPLSFHQNSPANAEKYGYWLTLPLGDYLLALKAPHLRRSYQSNKPVSEILSERIAETLWLALVSMTFATLVGIALGLFSALNQNHFWDNLIVTASVIGFSAPSFIAAILISLLFGYYLSEYTGLNMTGSLWDNDVYEGKGLELKNIILPALTLGMRPLAMIVQMTRNAMIEELSRDYIRTARAKGLNKWQVIVKHALKNALNPVITAASGWLASMMAGAFFVEYVFNWKGLGWVTINAVNNLDLPVIMGSTLLVALFFVVISILVDVLYAWIDPRVRLR
jgi:peptide/nickel transport system permease protein